MFITFEGIDACGKSTQSKLIEEALRQKGYDVLLTRQPGGTGIGTMIREILLNPDNTKMVPEVEVLLYMADRLQHLREIILPAVERKTIVLCDRYHDATLAYQGGGRQLSLEWLVPLQERYLVLPDLTVWFDIPVEESRRRLNVRNATENVDHCRLERENIAFFERVREAYLSFSQDEPERFIRINGEARIDVIQRQVLEIVLPLLD